MTKGIGLFLVFQLSFACSALPSQNITRPIVGIVLDLSGAVIQGADVTVENFGTSAIVTATGGYRGTFSVPGLLAREAAVERSNSA
jgi:hypothetical protein